METVLSDNSFFLFKHFQNSLLLTDKVVLDIKLNSRDTCDPSNSNCDKENEAIAASCAHAQRYLSNTMQLVEIFEILDEEDCVGAAIIALIKTVNKPISGLQNANYPIILSPGGRVGK